MSVTLLKNIKSLVNVRTITHILRGKDLTVLPCIENAYLTIEDGIILGYGKMDDISDSLSSIPHPIDLTGKLVLPCWCDSHTHMVFAGSRENEFVDKINGLSYAQIAARGGGILNSAQAIAAISEDQLFAEAWNRLEELAMMGTGSVEIKSGYGLSVAHELKMLRVIKKLKEKSGLLIRSTFLGAHTYPLAFRENHQGYIDMIINEMLPVIASEKLADFIDVFCEEGFFSPEETEQICTAGLAYGLRPKLHVNQMNSIGGIQAGINMNALSMDHLEQLNEKEIDLLSAWNGVCTLLPGAAFFLRMSFDHVRKMIARGCAIALASDFNPGSCPSGNMNLVIALACIQMRMLPAEAINAATINGAFAMDAGTETGSITIGKRANLLITKKIPSLSFLPYSFGHNLVDKVMINGQFI